MENKDEKQSYFDRIMEAVISRLEGEEDPKKKFDYLMDPPNIKTSSILSEIQLDSVAESSWLGDSFPSFLPLKELAVELAKWSPSKTGKGREQLTATMISEHKEILPMAFQNISDRKEKKKKKDDEE